MTVNYCPVCNLYWFQCKDGMTEFRLFVFAPFNPKKCKLCSDTSLKVPSSLIELRKKAQK